MSRLTTGLGLLLLAGCGGGAQQDQQASAGEAAPAARVVACEVLSQEDVAAVMGSPVQRTEPREVVADPKDTSPNAPYMTACTYIAERGQGLMTTTLMLQRQAGNTDPATALNQYVESVQKELGPYSLEPVAELGPGAGWHAETTTLWVFRPGWMVSLAIDKNAPTSLEGAKQLTVKALERLPGA